MIVSSTIISLMVFLNFWIVNITGLETSEPGLEPTTFGLLGMLLDDLNYQNT
jgi:hypothetical protein